SLARFGRKLTDAKSSASRENQTIALNQVVESRAGALCGKDGHPFPVPLKTYDETIDVMRLSLEAAKVGDTDKIDGLRRLDRFVQVVERSKAPSANFSETVARERQISDSLNEATAG